MGEYRKRRLPWVLMALGAIMALAALGMLSQTRDVVQYCVVAPDPGEKGEAIRALSESAQKLGESMKDSLAWTTLNAAVGAVSLSVGNNSVDANLIAIDEGWLEVYPRFLTQGERLSESELQDGARAIMLDEGLCFKLFGATLPEKPIVKLNGVDYRLTGTVRHGGSLLGGRGVGDALEYDAYIPLMSAVDAGLTLNALTLSAVPLGSSGAVVMFEESAREWMPGGQLINLKKEAMRQEILPRFLLLVVGLYAMVGLFRRLTVMVIGWFHGFSEALKLNYLRALLPRLAGLVALTLACYGALIGLTWLLMSFSVQPLYVFTEWVPENIVEWASISKVFWNRVSEAATLVRLGTRELRVIEFWGGLLRWGVILALLGAALLPKARRPKARRRSP